MKEQMINEMAKEAYESCFKDIHDMKGAYNDMLDSQVIEAKVKEEVNKAKLHRAQEKELAAHLNSKASKAYVKVFGKELVEVSQHHNTLQEEYDELMENKNHLLEEMNKLKANA